MMVTGSIAQRIARAAADCAIEASTDLRSAIRLAGSGAEAGSLVRLDRAQHGLEATIDLARASRAAAESPDTSGTIARWIGYDAMRVEASANEAMRAVSLLRTLVASGSEIGPTHSALRASDDTVRAAQQLETRLS